MGFGRRRVVEANRQAVAAALFHKRQHFGRKPIRLRPLSRLATEVLATRLRRGDAGADTFLY